MKIAMCLPASWDSGQCLCQWPCPLARANGGGGGSQYRFLELVALKETQANMSHAIKNLPLFGSGGENGTEIRGEQISFHQTLTSSAVQTLLLPLPQRGRPRGILA